MSDEGEDEGEDHLDEHLDERRCVPIIDEVLEPRNYYAVKGYGRILLLTAIFVYGVGLVLMRMSAERDKALESLRTADGNNPGGPDADDPD